MWSGNWAHHSLGLLTGPHVCKHPTPWVFISSGRKPKGQRVSHCFPQDRHLRSSHQFLVRPRLFTAASHASTHPIKHIRWLLEYTQHFQPQPSPGTLVVGTYSLIHHLSDTRLATYQLIHVSSCCGTRSSSVTSLTRLQC